MGQITTTNEAAFKRKPDMETPNANVLDIVVGDPLLRTVSTPIGTPDDDIRQLARDMFATMYEKRGIGLAAVQVGRPIRMIVFDAGTRASPRPGVMIDPVIEWSKKTCVVMEEGCLSIPGVHLDVSRPSDIKVSYTDLEGFRRTRDLGGMPARIVQHEIDHLDGVLITSRLG
jgi:peptide deformylase